VWHCVLLVIVLVIGRPGEKDWLSLVIFNFQNNAKQIEESSTMEELKGHGLLKEKDKQVIIICPSFTFSSLQHQSFPT